MQVLEKEGSRFEFNRRLLMFIIIALIVISTIAGFFIFNKNKVLLSPPNSVTRTISEISPGNYQVNLAISSDKDIISVREFIPYDANINSYSLVNQNSWCNGADIDKDGEVGFADQNRIRDNSGRTDCSEGNLWCNGADIDNDGDVDQTDFQAVWDNGGRTDCADLGDFQIFSFKPSENTWLIADNSTAINAVLSYNLAANPAFSIGGEYSYFLENELATADIEGQTSLCMSVVCFENETIFEDSMASVTINPPANGVYGCAWIISSSGEYISQIKLNHSEINESGDAVDCNASIIHKEQMDEFIIPLGWGTGEYTLRLYEPTVGFYDFPFNIAKEPWKIDECIQINEPGYYFQTEDIENNALTGPCITINSEDVTLDCQGYSMISENNVAGIYSSYSNVSLYNCNVDVGEGVGGIAVDLRGDNSELDNVVADNSYTGFSLTGSNNIVTYSMGCDNVNKDFVCFGAGYSGTGNWFSNITGCGFPVLNVNYENCY